MPRQTSKRPGLRQKPGPDKAPGGSRASGGLEFPSGERADPTRGSKPHVGTAGSWLEEGGGPRRRLSFLTVSLQQNRREADPQEGTGAL